MQRHIAQSAVVRYSVAVLCVASTVMFGVWLRPLALSADQLSLVAISIAGWVCGLGPALIAWGLATLAFAYYFTPPLDSLAIDLAELPRFTIFTALGLFMATITAALRRAKDALETRVAQRTADLTRTTTEALGAQRRFRDLVNSVEGILWEADAETFVFSFVSEQAERILGYPTHEWIREGTFWADHLHPEDREWAVRFCQEATAQKRNHDFEYRMIAVDGRVVWLRDLVTVVVEGDRPVRLRGVMIDITERKREDDERQERRWVAESLERVDRAIQGTNDLEQMMSDVLDAALAIFDCDRAWLMHPCDPEAACPF
jgi:PAS domain S-box-containing protein